MMRLTKMWNAREGSLPSLGFRPALLDFATMRIYPAPAAPTRGVAARGTMVAGFERGGFFYTRRAVERACREWRLAR